MGGALSRIRIPLLGGRRMEILDIFELFVVELKCSVVSRNWNESNGFYNATIN